MGRDIAGTSVRPAAMWRGRARTRDDETWGSGGRNPDFLPQTTTFLVLTAFNSVLSGRPAFYLVPPRRSKTHVLCPFVRKFTAFNCVLLSWGVVSEFSAKCRFFFKSSRAIPHKVARTSPEDTPGGGTGAGGHWSRRYAAASVAPRPAPAGPCTSRPRANVGRRRQPRAALPCRAGQPPGADAGGHRCKCGRCAAVHRQQQCGLATRRR